LNRTKKCFSTERLEGISAERLEAVSAEMFLQNEEHDSIGETISFARKKSLFFGSLAGTQFCC
jgi:hypothetical protein